MLDLLDISGKKRWRLPGLKLSLRFHSFIRIYTYFVDIL